MRCLGGELGGTLNSSPTHETVGGEASIHPCSPVLAATQSEQIKTAYTHALPGADGESWLL